MDFIQIITTVFTVPLVGALIWFLKKLVEEWLNLQKKQQEMFMKQQTDITTAFVDHTTKQTITLAAISNNLENLNNNFSDVSRENTRSILNGFERLNNYLELNSRELKEHREDLSNILNNICDKLK